MSTQHGRKRRLWQLSILTLIGLVMTVGVWLLYSPVALLLHSPELPPPTGSFPVGRTSYFWTDSSRPETWTDDPTDRRQLIVYVWYPATQRVDSSTAPYFPSLQELNGQFTSSEQRVLRAVRTRVLVDAEVMPGSNRFPVLLFSPGANLSSHFYSCLLEEMASQGFVVVAIEHCYEGRGQVFPDGRIAGPEYSRHMPPLNTPVADETRFYHAWAETRGLDAVFVLDQLVRINKSDRLFAGRLDLSRVGFFGHSIGGITAEHLARKEQRIRAAANIDGLLLVTDPRLIDPTGTDLGQPFLFMGQTQYRDVQDALLWTVKGASYRVLITGANHMSFSDLPFWTPGNRAGKVRRLAAMRAYLLAFFGRHLLEQDSKLLDGPSEAFPEASVENVSHGRNLGASP